MPLVAITGSEGQLGSELCRQFGDAAVGLDLPRLDLTNRESVWETLRSLRPRAVVNTAAYTLVDRAETESDLCRAINGTGVSHLVDACRALDCTLVQVSTNYVFSGNADRRTPFSESDVPSPRGVYARTKYEGELHASDWKKHIVVRTCGLYGHLGVRSAGNFVATMLRLGEARKRLRVVSDQYCTPSYVPHVARAIRFLLGTGIYGTYHVVNIGVTTWYQFALEIFCQAGLEVEVEAISTADYGAVAPRPAFGVLDAGKYHSLPGAPRMPPWQEALHEYCSSQRSRD